MCIKQKLNRLVLMNAYLFEDTNYRVSQRTYTGTRSVPIIRQLIEL